MTRISIVFGGFVFLARFDFDFYIKFGVKRIVCFFVIIGGVFVFFEFL